MNEQWVLFGLCPVVTKKLKSSISASAQQGVARGRKEGSRCQVGKHFRRELVTLPWGWTCAVSGVTWGWCWGHWASDSCWPKATGVYHLQMAICPLVERHFDCSCSQARPHTQSRWHEHAANRDRDLFLASVFNEHGNLIRIFLLCTEDIHWTDF